MRDRLTLMLGGTARAIWILTFHAACGRILRREAERLGYRSTFTIYDDQDQVRLTKACLEELGKDPKRFAPRGIHSQISRMKNELVTPEECPGTRRLVLGSDRRRDVRRVPAPPARLERRRLRRPADAHRPGARALPGRAREVAEGVPLHPRRRVPGHEPRAVPAAPAPGREARERLRSRRRRSERVRLPGRGHPEHPRVREGLPRNARRHARAELPLDEPDPPRGQRGHRQQQRAEAEESLLRARRGRARARRRGRGRARGGALRRGRDRRADRPRPLRERDRGLLPDERAVARARGRARPAGRPVPGHRRAALLRARRDPRRDRVPLRPREPDRRRLAAPNREPPQARDRRHVDREARHPCRGDRAHALPGHGRPRGRRRRAPRPAARSARSTRRWSP